MAVVKFKFEEWYTAYIRDKKKELKGLNFKFFNRATALEKKRTNEWR